MKYRIAVAANLEKIQNYIRAFGHLDTELIRVEAGVDPFRFDGLLLPGGIDVEPSLYGQENDGTSKVDPALDAWQFDVLDAFVKAEKPVLGICRGHQVLNVYFGGTLIQDIHSDIRHPAQDGDSHHEVKCLPNTIMSGLFGDSCCVNSSHHQAIDVPGNNYIVTAYSGDGIAEAAQHTMLPVFSVQWHPERTCYEMYQDGVVDGSKILSHFLSLCDRK